MKLRRGLEMKKRKSKPRWKRKRLRRHVLPATKCVKLNDKFLGSNAHHISAEIIIYIPQELHRHINHSLKSGYNMSVINILSFQYLYGQL